MAGVVTSRGRKDWRRILGIGNEECVVAHVKWKQRFEDMVVKLDSMLQLPGGLIKA